MHSTSDMGVNNVPAFLMKLWTLVEDPSTDELIAWDPVRAVRRVSDQISECVVVSRPVTGHNMKVHRILGQKHSLNFLSVVKA